METCEARSEARGVSPLSRPDFHSSAPVARRSPACVARHAAPHDDLRVVLAAFAALLLVAPAVAADETPSHLTTLAEQALVRTGLARDFLGAKLPCACLVWAPRGMRQHPRMRARLVPRTLDERFYYDTRFTARLSRTCARLRSWRHGLRSVRGKRVADFGCGALGQLRLLSESGAHRVGIDVDPLLPALYSEPGDRGDVGPGTVSPRVSGRPGNAWSAKSAEGWISS